ncbi:hypothetical protein QTP86_000501 [Hemibagrus guttatus]|nr:hypothetical protein QTP86_000501 [Hemibagrus guttatus]
MESLQDSGCPRKFGPSATMVLRRLVHALINNAQLVERLAESRPIRRAAQLTAFAITRAQIAGKIHAGELGQKGARLRDTFIREVKEGMKDVSRQIKDKNGDGKGGDASSPVGYLPKCRCELRLGPD